VWPVLKVKALAAPQSGHVLGRLFRMTSDLDERRELLEEAFRATLSVNADDRMPVAAAIAAECETLEDRYRSLDLMTAYPVVKRDTVLSAVGRTAPVLAEVGTASFTLQLMRDIRQSANWWP
jgi:hypothetical protein